MGNVKNSIRYYLFRERVNISTRVNGFLYFLRKLPLVGKKITPNVYQSYGLKHVLFILVAIGSVLLGVVAKGLMVGFYAGLIWIFDNLIHDDIGSMDIGGYIWAGLFLWVMMTFFINNVYNIWFSQVEPKVLEFMDNFRLPKKFFIRAKTLIDGVIDGIYYFPAAILFGWLTGSWILVLALPILYMALTFSGYFLSRLVLSKHKIALMTQSFIIIFAIILVFAVGVLLPILTGVAWVETIIFSSVITLANLLVGIGAFIGILNFEQEDLYLAVVLDRSTAISEGAKNIHTTTTENVQKKMTVTDSRGRFENKKGNAYLNALLFDRYRKEFRKILRFRLIATGVVVLAFLVLSRFWGDFTENVSELIPLLNILFIPIWISMFSVGRKMVQVVFLNCDNAMLHYPFYREKNVILSGFFDRLKRTLVFNSALMIAPLALALIIGFTGGDFSFFPMTALILISVVALFSFHDLFLYYILQPFAQDMQVKSPAYFIINMISSMGIWFIIGGGGDLVDMLFTSGTVFALTLLGVTVGYTIVGSLALIKFAPKTFKARV